MYNRHQRVVVIEHGEQGEQDNRVETTVGELPGVLGPMLGLDLDQDEVTASVVELLRTGFLRFEGDPGIDLEWLP